MTRVSLKEAYDNKDVVAQIYAIRDIAEGAEDTANGAVSTANTASEHVDALVPQVEGAVQNANNASASAQQSATTVATYDTRLTAVENADTQNVKLDTNQVITGHKKFVQTSTTGVPLDGERKGNGAGVSVTQTDQNMTTGGVQYYPGMYVYDSNGNRVGGWYPVKEEDNRTTLRMRFTNKAGETNELTVDGGFVLSNSMVSKKYVESTDGTTNNLVHRTSEETITGAKTFVSQHGVVMLGLKGLNVDVTANSYQESIPRIGTFDKNNEQLWQLETTISEAGVVTLNCRIRNSDGSIKSVRLAQGDLKQ